MTKDDQYKSELAKWNKLFEMTTPETQEAAEGLIQKAAYLHSVCWDLEQAINASGAIKIHPKHPEIQKAIPAVKEYSRMCESYANIVNKLNALRVRNVVDEDDELSDYE